MRCPCPWNCGDEIDDQLAADSTIPGLSDWFEHGLEILASAPERWTASRQPEAADS
jgi:hypothetical protein